VRVNAQFHQQLIAETEEEVKSENINSTQQFQLQSENRRFMLMNQKVLDQNKELKNNSNNNQANLKAQLEVLSMTSITEISERDRESRLNKEEAHL
jgi:hypothetical protein